MGANSRVNDDEAMPLTGHGAGSRDSIDSSSTASISLTLVDGASHTATEPSKSTNGHKSHTEGSYVNEKYHDSEEESWREDGYVPSGGKPAQRRTRIVFWLLVALCVGGWAMAFIIMATSPNNRHSTSDSSSGGSESEIVKPNTPHDGKKIPLDDVLGGMWGPVEHTISWISGPKGEDGLLLQKSEGGIGPYLHIEDVRNIHGMRANNNSIVLMKESVFFVNDERISPEKVWPSPDLKTVLAMTREKKNWRHSFTGLYWLFDVETQTAQPLDPEAPNGRVQLASWSPTSDAVVFTRDNNIYIRNLTSKAVKPITTDGGANLFYGIPDWVYEEEVFEGNSATWWSLDGKYISFLRTNETMVPEFPIDFYLSRPPGYTPEPGEEAYPYVQQIKYPKAGAPNPTVNLQFYDVEREESFSVNVDNNLKDDDRIIAEVIPASGGKMLVRETNRESYIVKVTVIDAAKREGKMVRSDNVDEIDGGWVEPSHSTTYIPSDPSAGRPHDGYIDTIIHEGYNHLAYFTPVENPKPMMLTTGNWEVVDAPSGVDLKNNVVYFVATKESPIDRHVYSVKLDGSELQMLNDSEKSAYYDVSFSNGAGYMLLKYQGPNIPWQKLISSPSNEDFYDEIIEENKNLARLSNEFSLPSLHYSTITVDGFKLPVVERRPPNFNETKKYPVLFHLYGGPGSQTVNKKFTVNFQTYVASNLGYLVVTVDGRGTGFNGRKFRCIVRRNLGYYEAHDQIQTAKEWGKKPYVDKTRIAIWGWSYGGFMTLKTLEQDAGETFQYGMAVAPVTDWRFYDSVYTERYMHMPQHNTEGYENASISNATSLSQNTRFLIMHGSADDNVHFQNTLTLLDKLDIMGMHNYDVHVFPDSNHGIYFHHAYKMVHQRLSDWLVNAFNGEWVRLRNPKPSGLKRVIRRLLHFG
ncbi:hypothetical protein McanMca71_002043 [Microsporum canis]|uniref:Probable dipeptidyl-aminopeptidase B n=1 Tax=Arthroderma otae (strain ATCC MYA-4605 / CBS 113480) TaxID=554155 RepID=DAPB_ARTOC|nr:dipeptidyl aminopeptidase [Microsporum canis CBS 113480]C5FYZ3.1 RecName: Full=Probable dipeptidyl-aminopeptidase B; Short=DPAP B [Microsporum canis CBS 113480]EEQ34741.1 dipeptidyl aminopeptidase [Microsporum canis CBS 113480]